MQALPATPSSQLHERCSQAWFPGPGTLSQPGSTSPRPGSGPGTAQSDRHAVSQAGCVGMRCCLSRLRAEPSAHLGPPGAAQCREDLLQCVSWRDGRIRRNDPGEGASSSLCHHCLNLNFHCRAAGCTNAGIAFLQCVKRVLTALSDVAEGWAELFCRPPGTALPPSPSGNETVPGSSQGVTDGPGQPLTCQDSFPRA